MVDSAKAAAAAVGDAAAIKIGRIPMIDNPIYGALDNMAIAGFVLIVILLLVKYGRGFLSNIAVRLGSMAGCIVAVATGRMGFEKVARASWFDVVLPFSFGMPIFGIVAILTITLVMIVVMIVVMIESTGMFLALSDITGKKINQTELTAGLRTDGLGTLIGGTIMIILGLLPKLAALVESVPQFVLGGAGLVMFGMVAATSIRILSGVDFKCNRFNLYIVAISIGAGLIPLVAPDWSQQMAHGLHPPLESGILLTSITAVILNFCFNGGKADEAGTIEAAKAAQAH